MQLSNGIGSCTIGWQKQHDSYKAEFEASQNALSLTVSGNSGPSVQGSWKSK